MKILAIALAFLIPFAFAATCEPQAVEPLVTLECTDATATSLTANAQVNKLEAGSLVRRGFVFMEGTTGTPSFNATPLVNPSFEVGDPPEGWLGMDGDLVVSAEQVKAGSYSGKLTQNAAGTRAFIGAGVPDLSAYWGRTLTLGAWVWCDAPERVRVALADKTEDGWELSLSSWHPGDSQWHFLTTSRRIRADSDDSWVQPVRIEGGDGIVSAYADDVVLVQNAVLEDGTFGTGAYSVAITQLKRDTSYRVRAFVADLQGVTYGNTVTCTTLP